jgi:hypothetical protein
MAPTPAVRPHPGLVVVSRDGHLSVAAKKNIPAGNLALAIDGPVVRQPTRYTVQISANEHVDAEKIGSDGTYPPWRFLNHSCSPNTRLEGRSLMAVRDIHAGDEVTFDYDTTEWDMASPFLCTCGAVTCRGMVRGYRHLTAEQRHRMIVAPHLQQALDEAQGSA